MITRLRLLILLGSVILALILWEALVKISRLPSFILPSPGQVWHRFLLTAKDGSLANHAGYTLVEVLLGLLIGTAVAAVAGYLLSRSPLVEALVGPYLVASQAIPIAAVAPLLIIWFGTGLAPRSSSVRWSCFSLSWSIQQSG